MAAPVGFDGRAGRQLCPYEAQYKYIKGDYVRDRYVMLIVGLVTDQQLLCRDSFGAH